MEKFYFVGKFGEPSHVEEDAGTKYISGYPVFSTYNKHNPNERHSEARFVLKQDGIEWAKYKNR